MSRMHEQEGKLRDHNEELSGHIRQLEVQERMLLQQEERQDE